jgi:Tol biopolymer transport system component
VDTVPSRPDVDVPGFGPPPDQDGLHLPPVQPPPAPPIERRHLRFPRIALLTALAWALTALLARRRLGHFPSDTAVVVLTTGWMGVGGLGLLADWLLRDRARTVAGWVAILTAAALPLSLVAWVPGIAQPRQFPIPGRPDLIASARPDGQVDLYLIRDGDGVHPIRLTRSDEIDEYDPELAPDGRRLAYAARGLSGSYDLFLMELDGDAVRSSHALYEGPCDDTSPTWSPDGRTILFAERCANNADLVEIAPDGTNLHRFVTPTGAFDPAWSADGARIAYAGWDLDHRYDVDIWVMNADGTHPRDIIDTGTNDTGPTWSPDGSRIAFTAATTEDNADVFIANADGSGARNLTTAWSEPDVAIDWTSDGQLLFVSTRAHLRKGNFLYVMRADGTDVRLVCII